MKFPSESPANTTPPAVDSAPPFGGLKYGNSHFISPVNGSSAFNDPDSFCAGSGTYTLPTKSCPARNGCSCPVYTSHSVEVATYNCPRTGSNDGEYQFVIPIAPGHVSTPFASGVIAGSTTGFPSAPISFAHVTFPNGFADKNFPFVRSSTYRNPFRFAWISSFLGCPSHCASTSTG